MIFAAGAGGPSASRMNFSLVFDTFGVDQSSSEISHYDSSTKLLNATFTNYQNLIIDVDVVGVVVVVFGPNVKNIYQ